MALRQSQEGSVGTMIRRRAKDPLLQNGIFYVLGAMIAFGFKYHYSRAGSEDLQWVLAPTIGILERIGGIPFDWETGAGFINHAYHIIVGPSCAGVNFLTIAFSTLFFSFAYRLGGNRLKLAWLGISLCMAYVVTLGVNALRIFGAIYLYRADMYGGWITPARVHRIEGTVIYFFFLVLIYVAGEKLSGHLALRTSKITERNLPWGIWRSLVPFFWYILFALGIPHLNMAYKRDAHRFLEHGLLVIFSCLSLLLLFFVGLLVYHRAVKSFIHRPLSPSPPAGEGGGEGGHKIHHRGANYGGNLS
jgi:exosortase K